MGRRWDRLGRVFPEGTRQVDVSKAQLWKQQEERPCVGD